MKCFFCDQKVHGIAGLAKHLIEQHDGLAYQGKLLYVCPVERNRLFCWCGEKCCKRRLGFRRTVLREPSSFRFHLKLKGGLEAHLLEIALGGGQ